MTSRSYGMFFRAARRFPFAAFAMSSVLALSACASAQIEEAAPTDASGLPTGPVDTGTYPNLNIVPVAAAPQLTPAERAAKEAQLRAARSRNAVQGAGAVPSDAGQLRQIGATHAEEALKRIEDAQ